MSRHQRPRSQRPRSRAILAASAVLLTVSLLGGSVPASAANGTAGTVTPSAATTAAPIAERALREAGAKGSGSIAYVILREQANVDRAASIADWDARGQYVYDQLTQTAARTQTGLLASLALRGVKATSFWIVNAVALEGADADTLRAVAMRADVARIEADPTAYIEPDAGSGAGSGAAIEATGDTTILATEWGIAETGAPTVWSQYNVRGEGIVVGTVDTGVLYTHPALVASYRGNQGNGTFNHDYDWYDGYGTCGAPCDGNGHGTHTMGTIVGEDGSNRIGMAPRARWIAARGCSTSSCSSTALLNSGQWMLAPTPVGGKQGQASLRPQVVSNSWGSNDGASTTYATMVSNWVAAGIFPVFANGNNGLNGCATVGSPGSYRNAYGVGAYDSGGRIADFSSRGPSPFSSEVKPDISAPGVNIRSSWNNGSYNTISGTSMATPHVAGAVALILSAAPTLIGQVSQVRGYLDGSARAVNDTSCGGSSSDNNVWGRGKLDVYGSVAAAPRGATGTLSGTVKVSGSTTAIAGATVAATANGVTRSTTTDTNGAYSMALPVGGYAVKVTKFGYSDGTAAPTISSGATTSVALTMATLATYTLRGTVVSSAGAPVAGASVSVDAPLAPVKTAADGSFSIAGVPSGSYTLGATPPSPCLGASTAVYGLTSASAAASLTLPVRTDVANHYCTIETSPGLNGGTTRSTLAGDDAYAAFTLPWAFNWYGTPVTTLYVSTNGFASVVPISSSSYANGTLPSTTLPNGFFPFWADLSIDSKAGIYAQSIGATAGSRRYVLEWRNATFFSSTTRVTFALILDEATGAVTYQYAQLGTDPVQLGSIASVGIEKGDGKDGLQYSYRTAALFDGKAIVWRTK